jgi:uncharacterized protein Veg
VGESGGRLKKNNAEFHNLYASLNIIQVIKTRDNRETVQYATSK